MNESSGMKMPIVVAMFAFLLAGNAYLYYQIDKLNTQVAKLSGSVKEDVEKLKEANTLTTQASRQRVENLKDELEAARRQAQMAAGQAKADASRHAEQLAQQLSAEQEKQQKLVMEARTEISAVKEETKVANTKISEVGTEVGNVKTELTSTKGELEKTIAGLTKVQGDLSNQGSLIATNSTELAALKQLGERNYFEFTLAKGKDLTKVGDVMMKLRGADPKKNRFTVELVVDDKKVEKKDKTLNEPVQFLTSKARQPYEIVVNNIGKNTISGYLATPKVQTSRN